MRLTPSKLSPHPALERTAWLSSFSSPATAAGAGAARSRPQPSTSTNTVGSGSSSPTALGAHSMESAPAGGFFLEERMEVMVGGKMLKFETGKIGRLADGAVTVTQGDTVVYASACAEKEPQALDFTPLRIDYFERFSAAGMTSGSYTKRDGKVRMVVSVRVMGWVEAPFSPSVSPKPTGVGPRDPGVAAHRPPAPPHAHGRVDV